VYPVVLTVGDWVDLRAVATPRDSSLVYPTGQHPGSDRLTPDCLVVLLGRQGVTVSHSAWEGWSNNFDSCCSYFAIPLFVEALRLRGVLRSAWKKGEHEDYKN